MGVSESISTYISYRRDHNSLSEFGNNLRLWGNEQKVQVNLQVDIYDATAFRKIDEFIESIKSTSGVVFLLNKEFFESPWCIAELCGHFENWGFDNHSVYIPLDGWIQGSVTDFFQSEWRRVSDFWKGNQELVDAEVKLDLLKEIFDNFSAINFSYRQSEVESCSGEIVWDCLRKNRQRSLIDYTVPDTGSVLEQIKLQCRERLERCSSLVTALEARDADRAVEKLLANIVSPTDPINRLYQASTLAVAGQSIADKTRIVDIAHQLALNLSHYLLNDDELIIRFSESQRYVLDQPIESAESHPMTVHLLAQRTADKRLTAGQIEGSGFSPPKDQAMHMSRIVRSGSYSVLGPFHGIMRSIWRELMPYDEIGDDELLSEDKMRALDRAIRRRFEAGKVIYFAVDAQDAKHPLNKPAIARMIKFRLPYLVLIKVNTSNLPSVFKSELTEYDMSDVLCQFKELQK